MSRPQPRQHRPDGRDDGQITAFVVVMAAALVLLIGLVLDGGLTLAARERALGEAQEAARAGAQGINLAAYRQNGSLILSPAKALADAGAEIAAHQGDMALAAAGEFELGAGTAEGTVDQHHGCRVLNARRRRRRARR